MDLEEILEMLLAISDEGTVITVEDYDDFYIIEMQKGDRNAEKQDY